MAADHLDETYRYIISVFVGRGQAPHFTEIAAKFGIPADAMRVMSTPRHRNRLRPD